MTAIENVTILRAIVHKVGNPTRGEALKLSPNNLTMNDAVVQKLLLKYLLGAINENDQNRFTHLHDVKMNEVYSYVADIFSDADNFTAVSAKIAQFLYSKSTHVKVKEGELCVVELDHVPFENDFVKAVGIFKAESKETFLKIFRYQ